MPVRDVVLWNSTTLGEYGEWCCLIPCRRQREISSNGVTGMSKAGENGVGTVGFREDGGEKVGDAKTAQCIFY
ncbi:hypothetical protein OIU78_012410 [Salix suchowensis]|nr:hypothetical protein OIU78_012410 [Salix suchowensis]